MSKRLAIAVGFAVSFASALPIAEAHSPPKALGIHWFGDGRAVIETNRGLIVEGADASFRIVCNDAYRSSLVEVPPVVASPDGRVLVGTYAAGLLRSTPDLCTFDPVGGPVAGLNTVDLQTEPLSSRAIYSLTLPADGSAAGLWASDDGGVGFRALSALQGAVTSLRVAPGAPGRLYALSTEQRDDELLADLATSTDGGQTFVSSSFPLEPTEVRAYLLDIDPVDVTRLFVRTETFDGITPERLLRRRDGGQTFDVALRAVGPLAMATAADGAFTWVASADGLWRSTDHGDTFAVIAGAPTRISCLAVHDGKLYACGDLDGRSGVFVSTDDGASFTHYLHFTDVRARLDCPARTSEGAACQVPFADWTLEQPYQPLAPSAGATTSAPDAARVADPLPSSAPGCSLSGAPPSPGATLDALIGLLIASGLGGLRPIRRRRRSVAARARSV